MSESTPYRARVRQKEITDTPVQQVMPQQVEQTDWQPVAASKGLSLFTVTLILGVMTFLGFSIVEAGLYLAQRYAQAPITTSILGGLLVAFTVCLAGLCMKEVRGYTAVNRYLSRTPQIKLLENQSRAKVVKALNKHAATFSKNSFAAHQYQGFSRTLNDDMSSAEVLRLYERTVTTPVAEKARAVVKSESMVSGSLAFVSPNHLIQTLSILWISLRTVRRVAQVYGLRPATTGNWKLLTILAQNLAAQSIFDLATDEIANQISGSLTAKFVENSAEAVAAGALNVRLGRTLIRLLS